MISSEKTYTLRVNDYDMYDRLRPSAILDIFQDVAGINADKLGCGYENLKRQGLIWVLLRTKFDVLDYPELYANVVAKTWPHKPGLADFDRDYQIFDTEGKLLVKGTSKWCVCNYISRKILLKKFDMYNCKDDEFVLDPTYPEGIKKVPAMSPEEYHETYVARSEFNDLDHNGHVNNTKYADYVTNALSLPKDDKITHFEIDYVHEMSRGKEFEMRLNNDGKVVKSECWQGDVNVFKCIMGIEKNN